MRPYRDFLRHILANGVLKNDRTGVGTVSTFGYQMRFDLRAGFPLVTSKKIHWHSVVHELLWLISGDTNIKYLRDNKVSIWDAWADENGDLGPVYGRQWRSWPTNDRKGVDQLRAVIDEIRANPDSRRLIVSAWNPAELPEMALAPCHTLFQFYVSNGELSCQLYQRSADAFLGVPFNIASYALLTHMVAQCCGLKVGEFVHSIGDAHIYLNHVEQVSTLLSRETAPLPTLVLEPLIRDIDDFSARDIRIEGYTPASAISAPVAV